MARLKPCPPGRLARAARLEAAPFQSSGAMRVCASLEPRPFCNFSLCKSRTRFGLKTLFFVVAFLVALSLTASGQEDSSGQHDASAQAQDTSMAGMHMEEQSLSTMPSPHAGSGTGWQPASVPGYEWMWMRGGWELMAHGAIFVDYNQQGGPRGGGAKAESVNWGMLMEQHKLGGGTILFRQMFSAESLTSPHPGFPELFQTGETYHDEQLFDHQHP